MSTRGGPTELPVHLRENAEAELARLPLDAASARSAEELLHELQVHQIELEMQNETLRQAGVVLEASRDRYVDLYEFAPVGYLTLSEAGLIAECNLTAATLLGVERKQLLNRRFDQFVIAADHDRFQREFVRAMATEEKLGLEVALNHGDGAVTHARLDCLRMGRTATKPTLRIALTDITAHKQVETELDQHRRHLEELVEQRTAALLETEARASLILQSSADGIYGIDSGGVITFINPAACAVLGYSAESVIGKPAHALFHHHRADGSAYPAHDCPGRFALHRGQQVRVDNEVYWHADGHAVPVIYAMHPMLQTDLGGNNVGNGGKGGAVVSFIDVSAQRATADARERALLAAENLARLRSEFVANMSHELRTPLNGVLGFAQIGLRNYLDSAKGRNAFEKIIISGNLLLGIINDILDFAKIEAGKVSVEQLDMHLAEVIEQVVELVSDRAHAKGIDLRVELAAGLPQTCLGDSMRLRQILLNLLSNAVKFTRSGSVTVSATCHGEELVFRITDTGIGMDEEQIGRLFHPFEQANGSTTRNFGGTGLGLAISKRIVELMGGEIRVESRPAVGSRFEVRLPYVEAVSPSVAENMAAGLANIAPSSGSPASAEKPLAGMHILVAEDDYVNRMVLEESLCSDGATVVMVDSGVEAIERLRRDGRAVYDVVLMDVQMPEMDGYEATRRILALAPDLPVIGQTAHALCEAQEKCFAAGMVAHIAKPIDSQTLVKLLLKHVPVKRTNR
jgi:PAS domain S-box-containing protein